MPMSCQRQHGFSLIELIMASGILTLMMVLLVNLAISGRDAQEFASRINRVTEVDQDILYGMRLELVSSVHLFGDNAADNAYLQRLSTAGQPPLLPGSRLPTLAAGDHNQKDTVANQITGNMLLLARLCWIDHFRCASGRDYRIDIYRWTHYYLTAEGDGPRQGSPIGLNLVRLVSEPLADADQIAAVDAADQAELLLHLLAGNADADGEVHSPVALTWSRDGDADAVGTFREIEPGTGLLSDTPLSPRPSSWAIRTDSEHSRDLLSYRHFSVATIHAEPAMGVGRFGVVTTTASGFPHGFEVQTVGAGAAKQVLLHLVLATTNMRGQVAWCDLQSTVDARDQ